MDIKKYVALIKATDLFKDIPYEELLTRFTFDSYSISNYKKSSIIHFEGEKCLFLDIILEGHVIIQRIDEKGNALTIVDFHSGDSIGGNLLFSKYPYYPMTIMAKTASKILHVKKSLVLELCQLNSTFLIEYLSSISDKTAILTNKIKVISLKSIRDSIIDFLKYESFLQNTNNIKLNITKKELAERLGVQRTSLSRELKKMKNDGLVDFNANYISIIDDTIIK